jgi:hypothetical protein
MLLLYQIINYDPYSTHTKKKTLKEDCFSNNDQMVDVVGFEVKLFKSETV